MRNISIESLSLIEDISFYIEWQTRRIVKQPLIIFNCFFFFFFFLFFQNGKVFHDVLIYSHVNEVTDLNAKLTTTE